MIAYVLRRLAYGCGTVLGVLAFLFGLFFLYATPEDMARRALGDKAPPQAIEQWIVNHEYHHPLFWNPENPGETLLVDHYRRMLSFDFGRSDADDVLVTKRLREGVGPSLTLTAPLFALGLLLSISLALFVATFRETYIDRVGVAICVLAMSISILLYIIGGQFLVARALKWFPISGYDPSPEVIARFLVLPVLVGLAASFGEQVRFYRTVFVEETSRDYVRTARAKGCGDGRVMWHHVLRNAMIPVFTIIGLQFSFLIAGAVIIENVFFLPGLGRLVLQAITQRDLIVVESVVMLLVLAVILVNFVVELAYAWIDPRLRKPA